MASEDSEQAGQTGKLIPSEAVTPLTPSRLAAKRPLTVDSPEGTPKIEFLQQSYMDGGDFPDSPPEGVHPMMWSMLKVIRRDVSKINDVQNQVTAIEDQIEKDGADIAQLKLATQHWTSLAKILASWDIVNKPLTWTAVGWLTNACEHGLIGLSRNSKFWFHKQHEHVCIHMFAYVKCILMPRCGEK